MLHDLAPSGQIKNLKILNSKFYPKIWRGNEKNSFNYELNFNYKTRRYNV